MLLGTLLKVLVAGSVLFPTAQADITANESGEIKKKCEVDEDGALDCYYNGFKLSFNEDDGNLGHSNNNGQKWYRIDVVPNLNYCDYESNCYDENDNLLIHCDAEGCVKPEDENGTGENGSGESGSGNEGGTGNGSGEQGDDHKKCEVNEYGYLNCYYNGFKLSFDEHDGLLCHSNNNGWKWYRIDVVPNLNYCDYESNCYDENDNLLIHCDAEGCVKPEDENPGTEEQGSEEERRSEEEQGTEEQETEEQDIEFDYDFTNCAINCNKLDDNNLNCHLDCHLDDNSNE